MILWLNPCRRRPPHAVTHPDKLTELANAFLESQKWGVDQPALVGYETRHDHMGSGEGRKVYQLLSGSHRWKAAQLARRRGVRIRIPVVVWAEADVRAAQGNLNRWRAIMDSGHALGSPT